MEESGIKLEEDPINQALENTVKLEEDVTNEVKRKDEGVQGLLAGDLRVIFIGDIDFRSKSEANDIITLVYQVTMDHVCPLVDWLIVL